MSNKLVYLIFTISLLIFILVYVFLPTYELESYYDENDQTFEYEELPPIYDGIMGEEYVTEKYEGITSLNRIWSKLKMMFLFENQKIIDSGLSLEEYYEENTQQVRQLYGSDNKQEFVDLLNSIKMLGNEIYEVKVVQNKIEVLDNSIKFVLVVLNKNLDYQFYTCIIYNIEEEKEVLYKITPYLEVK